MMATKWGLTRTQLDQFSLDSHEKAGAAQDSGAFDDQIVGIKDPEGVITSYSIHYTKLYDLSRGLPFRRSQRDRGRQTSLRGDLDGCGHVEAEQTLPVRDLHDDVQQSGDPTAGVQAPILRALPGRSATRPVVEGGRPREHRHRDAGAPGAALLRWWSYNFV